MKRFGYIFFLVCFGVIAVLQSVPAQDDAQSPLSAKLKERRLAYREVCQQLVDLSRRRYMDGTDNIDGLLKAQILLAEAELEITTDPKERIEKLRDNLVALRKLEEFQQQRLEVGAGRTDEAAKSKLARIRGEIMLLEEEQSQAP